MARFRSALALLALAVACSSPEAPGGILTGNWTWRGPDSTNTYFNLALTHAGSQVRATIQFCRPSMCGGLDVSGPYADRSVSFDLGVYSFDSHPLTSSLSGRLVSTDTLIAVLTNFWQPGIDTLVFVRTGGQSAAAP